MKAPGCSSIWLWTLFVICGLFVISHANINNDDDDEWIDPYDMLNYDPTTKRMRKPAESASYTNVPTKRREFSSDSCELPKCPDVSECTDKLSILQKEVDEHKKKEVTNFPQPRCVPVFRRFLAKLLKETAKLGLPDDANKHMHYDAEVKLSKLTVSEFSKLLSEDTDWTTGAMDEALSQILVKFKHHDPEAWKWRFEDTFYVELDTVLKVLLCVLIITAVICTEVWCLVSWFIQFRRMFAVCFFISLIWNWFHLYMLAFADHQKNAVQMESVNAKCTGLKQIDWKESLSEWYRHTWTLQDDPCKKYYEVLLVNPILLVPPTKAITVTITNFITDPLKHIGQGIGEFLRALLKDMPITLQIPVLLVIAGGIFVFMYGSAHAAIQHAMPWPRLGGRQDPPPPAVEQRQAPRLRENEYWAGGDAPQPLQDPHHNNNNHVRNRINHGFEAGEPNANAPQPNQEGIRTPQPRDSRSSMDLQQEFVGRHGDVQTVRVETLRSTGNMSSKDNIDCQQRTQEHAPGIERGLEPEAEDIQKEKKKEKEKDVSTKDKKEKKEAKTQDKRETEPNAPSQQIDVTTLGADQGSDVASAGPTVVLEDGKSFRTPVQETLQ
ncbi:chloride channel CLIC-like protein 1 isoform X2 [Triplophysa dalaica]|uniref:chloride channel CLIC-like protein 1 isoform X2 n=1 Tax=Triplophysa dalaica TaxID=1582913 RepID=UPI0024DFDD4A|nr:chloride channel CLIC-like protein 1 isoform X2 [Triplophysa dalaica]XP_056614686.1 chloride channel CLIC-like protein 1 isoform X2 [Triplophysa dalaica]